MGIIRLFRIGIDADKTLAKVDSMRVTRKRGGFIYRVFKKTRTAIKVPAVDDPQFDVAEAKYDDVCYCYEKLSRNIGEENNYAVLRKK